MSNHLIETVLSFLYKSPRECKNKNVAHSWILADHLEAVDETIFKRRRIF